MPRIPLLGGAYQAASVVASAQRQLNLFGEPLPEGQGEPSPMFLRPTPGLRRLCALPTHPVRGIRQASNGGVYVAAGGTLYRVDPTAWSYTALGSINPGTTPVSMVDNGTDLVIVDGSGTGWDVTLAWPVNRLATDTFSVITDATGSFRGGGSVDYLDTYFVFSVPDTPQFQASQSDAVAFDPLWFANKETAPDVLIALAVAKGEIWLLGERSTEVWFDSGQADFPFQRQQGVFIDHGCAAPASVQVLDNQVYWLSRTRRGAGVVVRGGGYQATRVSTYAIEAAISSYDVISDAIGMSYMMAGHMFYVLTFPRADRTWMLDATTGMWSELAWLDGDGVEHRHRANCMYSCNNTVVCGDWQTGTLYALDPRVYTDDGKPVKRLRMFPHIVSDGKRIAHHQFIADMQCGEAIRGDDDQVFLSWSDDRGRSFGNPVGTSLGVAGRYLTQMQWQRLGLARDRVYALEWACACPTALLGAWITAMPATS